jgi:hypothetical protein
MIVLICTLMLTVWLSTRLKRPRRRNEQQPATYRIVSPVHMSLWSTNTCIESTLVDLPMLSKRAVDHPRTILRYLQYFICLWTHVSAPETFITVAPNGSNTVQIEQNIHALLCRLPHETELYILADSDCAFTLSSRQRVIDVQSTGNAIYIFRTSALRKKLFRLLPVCQSFERTMCTIFRAHGSHANLSVIEKWTLPSHTKSRLCAFTLGYETTRVYRSKALRYWSKRPLQYDEKSEYWNFIRLALQHHDSADWLYVSFIGPTASILYLPRPVQQTLTRITRALPQTVDAILWNAPGDFAASDAWVEHIRFQLHTLRIQRMRYAERPQSVLVRTDAIRNTLQRFLPILYPLGVAMCTFWKTYRVV